MATGATQAALEADPADLGRELAAIPEDQWFERKSVRIAPRQLADSLIGFGNAEGGTLVVGLRDGVVEGTDSGIERRNAQMQAAADFSRPPVRARSRLLPCLRPDGSPDHLLVFEIEPADRVHANVRDEVFLRIGDENRQLSFAQRQELTFDKGDADYETRPFPQIGSGELDEKILNGYALASGASDPLRLLDARGLRRNDALTIAGGLLFLRQPQEGMPEAFVRVLRYRGRERGTGARQQLIEDVRVDGPLPNQLMEAREAIGRLAPSRRALVSGGRFGPVSLVPEDAWLEGLVNAVVHRSYSIGGDHIRVEIFDDRIEISSPGRFPGLVQLGDPLNAPRFARNPRIARVCKDLDFGQELGEGIRRMYEEMRQAGLEDPVYRQTAGSVELRLLAEPVDRRLEARLPDRSRAIVRTIRDGERLSTGEVAGALGMSRPVASRELRSLRDAGLIEWVGKSPKDPRAYWQIPRE